MIEVVCNYCSTLLFEHGTIFTCVGHPNSRFIVLNNGESGGSSEYRHRILIWLSEGVLPEPAGKEWSSGRFKVVEETFNWTLT